MCTLVRALNRTYIISEIRTLIGFIECRYDSLLSCKMQYEAVQHQSKELFKIRRCKVRTSVQTPRKTLHPRAYSLHFTSLWKPIRGPVYDFPLTLCDRRTVDYASQATAMDIVTRDYLNENTRIYFDEKHKWYYWHGLQVDEVIAFVQADSQAENRAGIMDFTPCLLEDFVS